LESAVVVTNVDLLTEQGILTERQGEKDARSERVNFLGVKIVNAGTCDDDVAVKIVITGNCDGKVDPAVAGRTGPKERHTRM